MLKKGFTLIEILVSMALVGILVAVLTPNIAKVMPDKKKALFIKAYSRTEMAVANMINDPEMYPVKYDLTDTESAGYTVFGLCSDAEVTGLLKANNPNEAAPKFQYYYAQELGTNYDNGKIQTSDGLSYKVDRTNIGDNQPRTKEAAQIEVYYGNDTENPIGTISVRNDGQVDCFDDDCRKYLDDRFDLKQKD